MRVGRIDVVCRLISRKREKEWRSQHWDGARERSAEGGIYSWDATSIRFNDTMEQQLRNTTTTNSPFRT